MWKSIFLFSLQKRLLQNINQLQESFFIREKVKFETRKLNLINEYNVLLTERSKIVRCRIYRPSSIHYCIPVQQCNKRSVQKSRFKYIFIITTNIDTQKTISQPSLLPLFHQQIQISKKLKKSSIYIKQQKILNIKPVLKQIELEDGKTYQYKYLVYSGNLNDWLDYSSIKTLNQSLLNQYSLVYSNIKKRNIKNIFKQVNNGNFIFYIPNGKHYGYDNFNFLSIYKKFLELCKANKNNLSNMQMLQFKIVLEGTQFFPYCKQADQLIKKQIRDYGIEVLYNSKLTKIDYLRRTLTLNQISQISYNILYCIIPQAIPAILKNADIDPYHINPKTLMNKKYKNIFVFGADILPTTYTFEAVQYQNRIICKNLQHLLTKSGQISQYNGRTKIPLYMNDKEIIEIVHYYNKKEAILSQQLQNKQKSFISQCTLFNFYFNKLSQYYLTQSYYNYNNYGNPYYILNPAIDSVKYIQDEKIDQSAPLVHNFNKRNYNNQEYSQSREQNSIILNQTEQINQNRTKKFKKHF